MWQYAYSRIPSTGRVPHIALCCLEGSTMSNLVHRRRRCARIVLHSILLPGGQYARGWGSQSFKKRSLEGFIPISCNHSSYSWRKDFTLWCSFWFLMYSMTEGRSKALYVKAAYPLAHPSNQGNQLRLLLIHLEVSCLRTFTNSLTAMVGCTSTHK